MVLSKHYELLTHPDSEDTEECLPAEVYEQMSKSLKRLIGPPTIHRARWKFKNGLEASVICGFGTYGGAQGLFEVAVYYKGSMIDDPTGHLEEHQVEEFLQYLKGCEYIGGINPPRRIDLEET